MSCGVGHRHGLDLAWLWLWCKPAAAAPGSWDPPYATGAALKKKKKATHGMIPFICDVQTRSIHRDENRLMGARSEGGEMRSYCLLNMRFYFG